jgi:hypothetical protein
MILVAGFCPMGCGETLILGEGRAVVCCARGCPRPFAVSEILADPEIHHVLEVDEGGWQGKHPLRERLDDQLLSCDLTGAMLDGLRSPPGRYRVTRVAAPGGKDTWVWESLP